MGEKLPKYYEMDMDKFNYKDLQEWMKEDTMVAIVDENLGGIIGYVSRVNAKRICEHLNKSDPWTGKLGDHCFE